MDLTGYANPRRYKRQDSVASAPSSQPRPAPSSELTGEALRLLVKLDARVVLHDLPTRFPRVLNKVAAAWSRPAQADRCFDELLMDARGARQGFPLSVVSELTTLRHYYLTHVFPKKNDPWEQSHLR
jgi:hypothetical protein